MIYSTDDFPASYITMSTKQKPILTETNSGKANQIGLIAYLPSYVPAKVDTEPFKLGLFLAISAGVALIFLIILLLTPLVNRKVKRELIRENTVARDDLDSPLR